MEEVGGEEIGKEEDSGECRKWGRDWKKRNRAKEGSKKKMNTYQHMAKRHI